MFTSIYITICVNCGTNLQKIICITLAVYTTVGRLFDILNSQNQKVKSWFVGWLGFVGRLVV